MASHIVKSYDEQLRTLNDTLVRMGGVVESQISAAMQALTRRDPDLALATVAGDARVDELERQVDEQVVTLLALRPYLPLAPAILAGNAAMAGCALLMLRGVALHLEQPLPLWRWPLFAAVALWMLAACAQERRR